MTVRDRFSKPSEKEAAVIRRMTDLIDVFRQVEPSMPTSYVAGFLAVAKEPGQGATHYAREMGVVVPVASRILLEIGKKARTGGPGYGLVDSMQGEEDLRQWNYYLTPKGLKVLDRLNDVMAR